MIVVHHLNNSRSQRILWLLEELGLTYEVKRYERNPVTMLAPESLKAVHPLGRAPVVVDDGIVLAESGAIIEALIEKYGQGKNLQPIPSDADAYRRYKFWLHYAEGSAMPPLLLSLVFSKMNEKVPFFVKPLVQMVSAPVKRLVIEPDIKVHFDFMENELNRSQWFAGNTLSAADIQMSFPLEAAHARGIIDSTRPKLNDFLNRIHTRPAYQRALKVGGPYDYA